MDIEKELNSHTKLEIESKIIGDIVMNKLRQLDQVAYIRYVSVYKSFQDQESFKDELNSLDQQSTKYDINKNQLKLIDLDSKVIAPKRKRSS